MNALTRDTGGNFSGSVTATSGGASNKGKIAPQKDLRQLRTNRVELDRTTQDGRQAQIHTALPGQIISFDAKKMTVRVQVAIQGVQRLGDGTRKYINIAPLVDVPVHFPSGGGYTLTFPVAAGDECLVVFSERSIDNWYAQGGVQKPSDLRMHDINDGFAIVGVRSQPKVLGGGSGGSRDLRAASGPPVAGTAQLRSDDGTLVVDLDMGQNQITVTAPTRVKLDTPIVEITGYLIVNNENNASDAAIMTGNMHVTQTVTADTDVIAGGHSGAHHVHPGIQRGGANTDPPS